MKFLIDTSPKKFNDQFISSELVRGQLLTPLTRYHNADNVEYAIDNGAFSKFYSKRFEGLLKRESNNKERCLFVTCPDVVGDARRTLEIWQYRDKFAKGWNMALVAQDGMEELSIPWADFDTLFVGGGDPWKESHGSINIIKTAKILGKHVHVGRVSTHRRYKLFNDLGVDTCDGSAIARYKERLPTLEAKLKGEQ